MQRLCKFWRSEIISQPLPEGEPVVTDRTAEQNRIDWVPSPLGRFVPNSARASDLPSPVNRVRTFGKRPPYTGDLPMAAAPGRFSRYRQRAFELPPRRQLSAAPEAEGSLLADRRKAWSTRRCAHLGIPARRDVRQMPEEEQAFDLRYRIKSEAEAYERNVLECQLSSNVRGESEYATTKSFVHRRAPTERRH